MSQSTFILSPEERYDQLQQTSTRSITFNDDMHGPTIITLTLTLPPFVLPYFWKRYKLSKQDIKRYANYFPAQYYWLTALLFGIDVIASAIKPSFASAQEVSISCKPLALLKILKLCDHISPRSVLSTQTQHIPPPPFFIVSADTIQYLSSMIYHDLKPFVKNPVSKLFPLHGTLYLPIHAEQDGILLKRVVKESDFIASGKHTRGCATLPLWIEVVDAELPKNTICFAVVEDCILLKA
jgi:hypothetical protein